MNRRNARHSDSVRNRLILGNMMILGLILTGLGLLLRHGAALQMSRNLDRDMLAIVRPFASRYSNQLLTQLRGRLVLPAGVLPSIPRGQEKVSLRALDRKRCQMISGKPISPYDEWGYAEALNGTSHFSTVVLDGEKARVLSVPLKQDGKVDGVLQMVRSMKEIQRQLDSLTYLMTMLIPVALIATGVGGFYMTTRALQPVRKITQSASRIQAYDLSERLPVLGDDEFAELATTFNGMLARLELSFERQRRFTADASHELRTPLAAITGEVSLARSAQRSVVEYQSTLESVAHSADRMRRIVHDLLELARFGESQGSSPFELVDLLGVVRGAVEQMRKIHPDGATVSYDTPNVGPVYIVGDGHSLERLCINLIENALRYTPSSGTVSLFVSVSTESATLVVADTGEGIAPEHLPHVFDSFYRVDASRARHLGGTGLGLSICKNIVELHQGTIRVESTVGIGTTVLIHLPQARIS